VRSNAADVVAMAFEKLWILNLGWLARGKGKKKSIIAVIKYMLCERERVTECVWEYILYSCLTSALLVQILCRLASYIYISYISYIIYSWTLIYHWGSGKREQMLHIYKQVEAFHSRSKWVLF
jgi:hypothetical protein